MIPTYDERENLASLVAEVHTVLPDAHVLVVDDASPDGTGALADSLAESDPRVHVLHRPQKVGLGPAYIAGFLWALERDYAFVFEMDADFSHDPVYLPDFLDLMEDQDLVLGCRYMAGGGVEGWSLHRRVLSRVGNAYAHRALGLPLHDMTGGYKCFRREVLERVDLGLVRSKGYLFQVELSWRAWNLGFRVAELPIVFRERREGKSKLDRATVREAMTGVIRMRMGLG